MKVWLNGALLEAGQARIDPADRGFTLGDGVFETIAFRGGKVLRLPAHLERLKYGCEVLGIPYPEVNFENALAQLVAGNNLQDAILRVTVTRGPAERGLLPKGDVHPTVFASAALPETRPPPRCVIASTVRRNRHSPLSRIKSINYLDNILARREAAARDADEAIILNLEGFVAEATTANVFILRDGQALTPPVTDGALPGVMRAAVLQTGGAWEQSLRPDDLTNADGVFLTNSLGIRTAASVNGKLPGKIIHKFVEDLKTRL